MPARAVLAVTSGCVPCGLQVGWLSLLPMPISSCCYWRAALRRLLAGANCLDRWLSLSFCLPQIADDAKVL